MRFGGSAFFCLRVQIPIVNYESGWLGYASQEPGDVLSRWPCIVAIQLARIFMNPAFADWNGEGGHFHWTGKWEGFSSLYNHSTLGVAWLCLLLTIALWFAMPDRRQVALWMILVFSGAVFALAGVFSSFAHVIDLTEMIKYTNDGAGGRYLMPVLVAWFVIVMTLFFVDLNADGVDRNPNALSIPK